jgi:hypothetical protein
MVLGVNRDRDLLAVSIYMVCHLEASPQFIASLHRDDC